MLSYNEIKPKKYIIVEAEPWEVIEAQVSRKQANKPVNKTKIKNLINGRVVEHTFHVSDKVHEAEIERRKIKYLYSNEAKGEIWFSDQENPKDRFTLESSVVGDKIKFIKENSEISANTFMIDDENVIIGIRYPMTVTLEVAEAPPNIKGDTATGGRKIVTLETGATAQTPMFINKGDSVVINVEREEYVERAEKG